MSTPMAPRVVARPHPGRRRQFNPASDYAALHDAAAQRPQPLRREPHWAAQRDALYGQPARQVARATAVMAIWGSPALAWVDVLHNSGCAKFIPDYVVYVAFR